MIIIDYGKLTNADDRTVVDFELLSLCDELIVTSSSTFGFAAAMKAGILPLYVDVGLTGKIESRKSAECKRLHLGTSFHMIENQFSIT